MLRKLEGLGGLANVRDIEDPALHAEAWPKSLGRRPARLFGDAALRRRWLRWLDGWDAPASASWTAELFNHPQRRRALLRCQPSSSRRRRPGFLGTATAWVATKLRRRPSLLPKLPCGCVLVRGRCMNFDGGGARNCLAAAAAQGAGGFHP